MAKKYYAIRVGKKTGVFFTEWADVKPYIDGFKNAEYKSFTSEKAAQTYFDNFNDQSFDSSTFAVHVYSDGSYFPQTPTRFGSGAVILVDNQEVHQISCQYNDEHFAKTRNIAGEVMAIVESLTYCQEQGWTSVLFFVDYQGLISWWNGSWKANNPVSHYFLRAVRHFGKTMTINFKKVDAHTGIHYNEMADILAKKGLIKKEIINF